MSTKFDVFYNTPSDLVKAATAGIVAGLTYLSAALPDGLSGPEVIGIVSAVVAGFGTVLGIYSTNKKDDPTEDPSVPVEEGVPLAEPVATQPVDPAVETFENEGGATPYVEGQNG